MLAQRLLGASYPLRIASATEGSLVRRRAGAEHTPSPTHRSVAPTQRAAFIPHSAPGLQFCMEALRCQAGNKERQQNAPTEESHTEETETRQEGEENSRKL